MSTRSLILTLAAVTLIAIPALTFAQGGPGACGNDPQGMGMGPGSGHGRGGHGGPGRGLVDGRMGDYLGLSDQQKAQIETIQDAARSQGDDLRAQLASGRAAYHQATPAGSFDEAAARAFAEAQAALHAELMVQRLRTWNEVVAVLTPEQQAKMAEFRDLADDLGGGRRGGRRSGGWR